tara:strand:+ start:984 stop:1682 length:699 start_codon:yes stop_codon:yes gene_type:complete
LENQFKERFRKLNPLELVATFNKNLNRSWDIDERRQFLETLRKEFEKRNICIENITSPFAIRSNGFIMNKQSEAVYVAKKVIPKKDLTRQIPITLLLDSEYEQHECVYLNPKLVLIDEPIIDMRKYLEHGCSPILFAVQHDKVQTVFNVTGIRDMYLIGFKFSNQIKSVNLINGRKEHVLQLAIPSKTLLFLPQKLILEFNTFLLAKRQSIEKFLNDIHSIQLLPTYKTPKS